MIRTSLFACAITAFCLSPTYETGSLRAQPVLQNPDQPAAPVCFDDQKVVRATLRDEADVRYVQSFIEDFWSHEVGIGDIDFRIAATDLHNLTDVGIEYRVLIEDVQVLIDAEQAAHAAAGLNAWFDDFHTLTEINNYLELLAENHPTLASTLNIGTSFQNRPIHGIRISSGGSGKPAVLFDSCQHAREWISPMVTMYLADQLISGYGSDSDLTAFVDAVDIYIFPVANPDGYEYTWATNRLWRKNRRSNLDGSFGVDLNRNWGYAWGGAGSSGFPGSDLYRGTAPFSEPETAGFRDFVLAHPEIRAHIDFHSYGQMILSPWGYDYEYLAPTLDANEFRELGESMAAAMFSVVGGVPYSAGPIAGILYQASGGGVDWFYGDGGRCSYTIELRDQGDNGFILPASEILPTCIENLEAIKQLALWVQNASHVRLYHPQAELPSVALPDHAIGLTIQARTWPNAQLDPASVKLNYRLHGQGAFTEVIMTAGSPAVFRNFTASLPATPCGEIFEYYFTAASTDAETAILPASAPTQYFTLPVAQIAIPVSLNVESPTGWLITAPGDTATRGKWENGAPVGNAFSSSGNYAITYTQPDADHTAMGTNCFLTGNGPFSQQNPTYVNGITTLTTPTLNVTGEGEAHVSFWAFFNNSGVVQDDLEVRISNNNGTNWVTLVDINSSTYATPETVYWQRFLYRVSDYMTPSNQMKMRFIARNTAPTTNIVEAAVDDIEFFFVKCPPVPGDLNGDRDVNLADHTEFLDCLDGPEINYASGCQQADLDTAPDGDVDMADFINFQTIFTGP